MMETIFSCFSARIVLIMCFPMALLMFIIGRWQRGSEGGWFRNEILFRLCFIFIIPLLDTLTIIWRSHQGNILKVNATSSSGGIAKLLRNVFTFYYRCAFRGCYVSSKESDVLFFPTPEKENTFAIKLLLMLLLLFLCSSYNLL